MKFGKAFSTLRRRISIRRMKKLIRMFSSLAQTGSINTILFFPPGHFYSPLPNLNEVRANANSLFAANKKVSAVNLREQDQLRLLKQFAEYYEEFPFKDHADGTYRYSLSNPFFGYGDAIIAYSFLRKFKPKRIIEVGSGHSSALMLDINDHFLNGEIRFTFIEPYAERLLSLLTEADREKCTLIAEPVQAVSSDLFLELQAEDILFIDSSHVVKIGSDVAHLMFNILPNLKPGVIVHFHDVLWPFEYHEDWLHQGRAWNEAYFLRAFLQYNEAFEILYFNSFIGTCFAEEVGELLPLCLENIGGSIWLRKKA